MNRAVLKSYCVGVRRDRGGRPVLAVRAGEEVPRHEWAVTLAAWRGGVICVCQGMPVPARVNEKIRILPIKQTLIRSLIHVVGRVYEYDYMQYTCSKLLYNCTVLVYSNYQTPMCAGARGSEAKSDHGPCRPGAVWMFQAPSLQSTYHERLAGTYSGLGLLQPNGSVTAVHGPAGWLLVCTTAPLGLSSGTSC